ncbi:MAG: hypothetical protein IJT91_06050, partial [Clostridia bacterium]|nr:hypothetical protein [Clostridia bacterium]
FYTGGIMTTEFNPRFNDMKTRIKNILDTAKKRKGVVFIALALILAMTLSSVVSCTNDNEEITAEKDTVSDCKLIVLGKDVTNTLNDGDLRFDKENSTVYLPLKSTLRALNINVFTDFIYRGLDGNEEKVDANGNGYYFYTCDRLFHFDKEKERIFSGERNRDIYYFSPSELDKEPYYETESDYCINLKYLERFFNDIGYTVIVNYENRTVLINLDIEYNDEIFVPDFINTLAIQYYWSVFSMEFDENDSVWIDSLLPYFQQFMLAPASNQFEIVDEFKPYQVENGKYGKQTVVIPKNDMVRILESKFALNVRTEMSDYYNEDRTAFELYPLGRGQIYAECYRVEKDGGIYTAYCKGGRYEIDSENDRINYLAHFKLGIKLTENGDYKFVFCKNIQDDSIPVDDSGIDYRHVSNIYGNTTSIIENDSAAYFTTNDGLYLYDKLNGRTRILVEETNISGFDVDGDDLYYISNYEAVYRYNLKTGKTEFVIDENEPENEYGIRNFGGISEVKVYGECLYFNFGTTALVKYDPKEKTMVPIIEDCAYGTVIYDGWIYYMEHGSKSFTVFRNNLENGKSEILCGDGVPKRERDYSGDSLFYDNFVIVDGTLYATSRFPGKIWRYGGGTLTEVVDCGENFVDSMISYNGKIYFTKDDEKEYENEPYTFSIYEYDPKTGNVTLQYEKIQSDSYRFAILNGYFLTKNSYDADASTYKIKQ